MEEVQKERVKYYGVWCKYLNVTDCPLKELNGRTFITEYKHEAERKAACCQEIVPDTTYTVFRFEPKFKKERQQ